MTWVKLDDGFAQHPKVAGLSDRAFRGHVKALLYCGRYETDGRIPKSSLPELGVRSKEVAGLEGSGLWRPENGSFWIHDFLHYNPSSASLRARREEAAQRMRKVRANSERTSPELDPKFEKGSPNPDPTRTRIPEPVLPSIEEGIAVDVDSIGEFVAELKDSDEKTEGILKAMRCELPEGAFRSALESLQRRRGEDPPLVSETRYFVATLASMKREGQYA